MTMTSTKYRPLQSALALGFACFLAVMTCGTAQAEPQPKAHHRVHLSSVGTLDITYKSDNPGHATAEIRARLKAKKLPRH